PRSRRRGLRPRGRDRRSPPPGGFAADLPGERGGATPARSPSGPSGHLPMNGEEDFCPLLSGAYLSVGPGPPSAEWAPPFAGPGPPFARSVLPVPLPLLLPAAVGALVPVALGVRWPACPSSPCL